MTIEHEEVTEPRIVAAGISEDDVFIWMDNKVHAFRSLKCALAERERIKKALEEVDARILSLTSNAALDLIDSANNARNFIGS